MRKAFLWLSVLTLLVAGFLRVSQLAQVPPGPHFDEAANILITRSIAFDGANLFPIANSYQGRESLYFYLNAPVFWLVGDDVFAMRLSSMFINLVTIAAAIGLGRFMFPGRRGQVIGLAAGVMMAVSFHQIFMSRQAYRAVSLPMMQALGLLFLWRGLNVRRRGWLWLGLGGLFCGGAIYTYMASRLFPLWLGLGGLALLLLDRAGWRGRLRQGAIFFGALLVAMIPMIVYALDNPDIFFQRLNEVSEGAVEVSLAESIRRHMEMFFIRGDFGNLRYNIPGRPYFTLPEGLLLLIGLGVSVSRLVNRKLPATRRAAYFLALLSPLMVIPSVISVAGFPPSHMRSLGMVPLIFILVAIGFESVWRAIAGWLKFDFRDGRLLAAMTSVVLLVGGGLVYRSYMDWARRADLFYQADGDLALAADWLKTAGGDETLVYVASYHREHPTIITGWDGPVTWLGGDSLILPPEGREGLVIVSRSVTIPAALAELLAGAQVEDVPSGPDGAPAFTAYRLRGEDAANVINTDLAVQNALLRLEGIESEPTPSGSMAQVMMVWRVLQTPPYYRLRPVVQLEDAHGGTLARADLFLLGTSSWRPGETLLQQVRLDVPVGLPPGDYALKVAWVDRETDLRVPYLDDSGANAGTEAEIGTIRVIRPTAFPSADALSIDRRHDEAVSEGVRLLGWNELPESIRPGEALLPVLFWQAVPTDEQRDSVAMRAVLRAESDTVLWAGELNYAPSGWMDGELVRTRLCWDISRDQSPGNYELLLQAGEIELSMGMVEVVGVPRLFEPPPVGEVADAWFGDSLKLYGYTILPSESGEGLVLELVWYADTPVNTDYTVFVHMVDADGAIIEQDDAMPQGYTYPTSLWATSEYVIDRYTFARDDGVAFRVGLYVQATGIRLPVRDSAEKLKGNYLTIINHS